VGGIVVDQQQPPFAPEVEACILVSGQVGGRGERLRQHQPDNEARAFAGHALDPQLAAHDVHQRLRDREAEADPGALGRRSAALERQQDTHDIGRRDADAAVGHLEGRQLVAIVHLQRDLAVIGELDRVGQEVDQHLPQPLGIGADIFGQGRRKVEPQRQPLHRRLRFEHCDHLFEEGGKADRVARQLQRTAFDLCDIEQAFDQIGQMLGAAADHLAGLHPVSPVTAFEQLGVAVYGVQW
jgi:hypothetical protein